MPSLSFYMGSGKIFLVIARRPTADEAIPSIAGNIIEICPLDCIVLKLSQRLHQIGSSLRASQ